MYELRLEHQGRRWTVPLKEGSRWRIGRSPDCEVHVPDRRVSSDHAELLFDDGAFLLRRTKGKCAVELDGSAVESARIGGGTSFQIAGTTFTLLNVQDGMNLIDASTVLRRGHDDTPAPSALPAAPSSSDVTGSRASRDSNAASVSLLAELLSLLAGAHDRESLTRRVLDLACLRLTATRALLARVGEDEQIEPIAARGFDEGADIGAVVSKTVLKRILEKRQAVLIGNTARLPSGLQHQESVVRNHIRAIACSPVFDVAGRLAAVLYLDNQDRPAEFNVAEAELLIWLGQVWSLLDDNLQMRRRLEAEVSALKRGAVADVQMVVESPSMVRLLERVEKVAQADACVLIQGESGTGKEGIARLLHRRSPRADRPFVACNCAAIPADLFESEMFGHLRGAFTGAHVDRKGAFVEAHGGTLFLDEVGELPAPLQAKLLRVIQEKRVRPVGGDRDAAVDVRIVCASNRNLAAATRDGAFREDLYYRMATVTLDVPPLRERTEDILPLARYFVELLGGGARALAPTAEARLLEHTWPGNVRELRSVLEQAVIFAAGREIQADELGLESGVRGAIALGTDSLAAVERRHILQVLERLGGNKSEAAKVLGLARSTLNLKLKSYGEG
ncbi:MAG: sigma 54-interacting transcriptional regulator [Planctomycetes bacterium]|nr:sigma 54-interacting transcriptional regulator [Planctomycetota bacterium]